MADKMHFDLVSPDRRLASLQVTAVQIPGTDGDLTAMPDHAPMITTLRPGILKIEGADGGDQAYFVTGGFADVAGPTTTILAEQALPTSEVTAEVTAARELNAAQRTALEDALRKAAGAKVQVELKIDPAIIGGLIVKVGSRMIDSSISSKLQRLQLAMKGVG